MYTATGIIGAISRLDASNMGSLDLSPAGLHAESRAPGQCIHKIFEQIAQLTPDAIAIEAPGESWSYAELNHYADLIANRLKASGVKQEELVGSCLLRSPEAIAGLLGILKAGAAYVPFNLSYPPARLRFMLEDSGVRFLLCDEAGTFKLSGLVDERCVFIDPKNLLDLKSAAGELAEVACDGGNLAYLMYTSGSTGIPKGVLIEQRGITRLVCSPNYAVLSPADVFIQLSPLSFDASTFEIWGALLNGARLVLPPGHSLTLAEISEAIQESGVTTLWLTSGLFNAMVDEHPEAFSGLRQLLTGGDVLSIEHIRKAAQAMPFGCVINGYGPTENTTFTCCHRVREQDLARTSVPIGRPISQTTVDILNSDLQPTLRGDIGELYIGGAGLARGYWKQPEFTRERFIPNPFLGGDEDARLYRSGDLVRMNDDGDMEFVGRLDQQVKVRGCRVEPGEVEAALSDFPGLTASAVVAKGESADRKHLCCYFVPAGDQPASLTAVADYLRTRLPTHLVPDEFCPLPALPLDPNGKVDRRALAQTSYRPKDRLLAPEPSDSMEREILAIWQDLFRLRNIGLDDDFFQLGGHSLLAARLFAQVNAKFGRRIPLSAMFETSTVRKLAAALRDESLVPAVSSCTKLRAGSDSALFLVRHPGANVLNYRELAVRLSSYTVYGLQPSDLDASELGAASLPELAAKYNLALRTTQPKGPYWLGGYCAGGQIAYEMARQLGSEGDAVTLLALFDAMGEPESHELARAGRWVQVLSRSIRIVRWKANRVGLNAVRVELRQLVSDLKLAFSRLFHKQVEPPKTVAEGFEEMRHNYSREKYRGNVLLFRTQESCEYSGTYSFGWQDLVVGDIEVHDIPGDHEYILDKPQVDVFAERLADALQRVEQTLRQSFKTDNNGYVTSGSSAFQNAES